MRRRSVRTGVEKMDWECSRDVMDKQRINGHARRRPEVEPRQMLK